MKKSLLPWVGAIIIVAAGGYYFLKKPASGSQPTTSQIQQIYGQSSVSQAISNIGSRRVRTRSAGRIPKMNKARS